MDPGRSEEPSRRQLLLQTRLLLGMFVACSTIAGYEAYRASSGKRRRRRKWKWGALSGLWLALTLWAWRRSKGAPERELAE